MKTYLAGAFLALFLAAFPATASDPAAGNHLSEAMGHYKDRDRDGKIDEAIRSLEKAAKEAQESDDTELRYDISILHSRCLYFKGARASGVEEKLNLFEAGVSKADTAKALSDEYAEAYYFHALNLARWAEIKGVSASLGKKQELIDHLNGALARVTRPNSYGEYLAGEVVEGYGPDRILGRIFFKLPEAAGGSRERSLSHLRRAHSRAPSLALNHVYLAETLASERKDRPEAIRILDSLLKNDPRKLNPSRVPETIEEFELARKLRSEI